jgi:hypothetical protein
MRGSPHREVMPPAPPPAIVAFYLPQYHPILENDEWWGAGFTEWTHVAKARALFRGHYQPNIPGELGFYDLRVPETRAAQAELAQRYGVSAFCYWHYWFGGRRILERPFNEVLESGEPRFPFCLGWANHDWYGNPYRLLMEQTYPGLDDHTAHFYALLKAFSDDRYFTVDGKPLLYIFKPLLIPDAKRVTDHWRELAHRAGLKGLHLVGEGRTPWNPFDYGFDAEVRVGMPPPLDDLTWRRPVQTTRHLHRRLLNRPTIYDYSAVCRMFLPQAEPGVVSYPCVVPNWDNTPRWGIDGIVLMDATPERFRTHLREALHRVDAQAEPCSVVFVKSWNEWAEGNYLEPDRRFGRGYLEVLREELERVRSSQPEPYDLRRSVVSTNSTATRSVKVAVNEGGGKA